MSFHNHSVRTDGMSGTALKWCIGLALLGVLAISAVFLLAGYRTQVLGALVWLPLVLCPLMHMFMHGTHGEHDHGGHGWRNQARRRDNGGS